MAFLEGTFLQEGAQGVLDRMQKTMMRDHQANLMLKDFDKKFFHFREPPKDYSTKNTVLQDLVKALINQKKIRLLYQSPGKEPKEHLLEPLTMLMFKRGLYLVGRRRDSETRDITFAVERMVSVSLLSDGFSYPMDYDPAVRFRNSFGLVQEKDPRDISLLFHPRVAPGVASRKWHPSQETITRPSGALEVHLCIEPGSELQAWILSYGDYVKVLQPDSLREELRERLQRALDQSKALEDQWFVP